MGNSRGTARYVIGERLRFHRREKNFSREQLAVKIEVSVDTIARWEQGDPIKEPDCHRLAKTLGVTFEELVGADRVHEAGAAYLPAGARPLPTAYVQVPVLGNCPASEKQIINDEIVRLEALPRSEVRGRKLYLILAKGDSMNRSGIDDGDMVVVDSERQPVNGNIVVALVDGECTIKRYSFDGQTVTLSPDSTNSRHQPMVFTKKHQVLMRGVAERVWMKRLK